MRDPACARTCQNRKFLAYSTASSLDFKSYDFLCFAAFSGWFAEAIFKTAANDIVTPGFCSKQDLYLNPQAIQGPAYSQDLAYNWDLPSLRTTDLDPSLHLGPDMYVGPGFCSSFYGTYAIIVLALMASANI